MGSGWTGCTGLEKEAAMMTITLQVRSRETHLKKHIIIYSN
jgi:hypothetical protein